MAAVQSLFGSTLWHHAAANIENTSCSLLQRKESWMEMKAEIVAMTAEAIDKKPLPEAEKY